MGRSTLETSYECVSFVNGGGSVVCSGCVMPAREQMTPVRTAGPLHQNHHGTKGRGGLIKALRTPLSAGGLALLLLCCGPGAPAELGDHFCHPTCALFFSGFGFKWEPGGCVRG